MTDFSGEVLSCGFEYNTISSTEFDVTIARNLGGYETRNLNRSRPDRVWELGERNYTRTKMLELRAFYIRHNGPERSWLLTDWEDYTATAEEITIANGQAFLGAQHIVPGSETIFRNGSPYTDYSLDDETGVLTVGSPTLAGTYTWTGEYYKKVRFDGPFRTEFLPSGKNGSEMIFHIFSLPVVQVIEANPL